MTDSPGAAGVTPIYNTVNNVNSDSAMTSHVTLPTTSRFVVVLTSPCNEQAGGRAWRRHNQSRAASSLKRQLTALVKVTEHRAKHAWRDAMICEHRGPKDTHSDNRSEFQYSTVGLRYFVTVLFYRCKTCAIVMSF